jgi:hypothetical protein
MATTVYSKQICAWEEARMSSQSLFFLFRMNSDISAEFSPGFVQFLQYNDRVVQYNDRVVQYNDSVVQYNDRVVQYNDRVIQYLDLGGHLIPKF